MSKTIGDFLIERLGERSITREFVFPHDVINGIMGSLNRLQKQMDFVQVSHEENAAFMACNHSKFTGEVGVCLATSKESLK